MYYLSFLCVYFIFLTPTYHTLHHRTLVRRVKQQTVLAGDLKGIHEVAEVARCPFLILFIIIRPYLVLYDDRICVIYDLVLVAGLHQHTFGGGGSDLIFYFLSLFYIILINYSSLHSGFRVFRDLEEFSSQEACPRGQRLYMATSTLITLSSSFLHVTPNHLQVLLFMSKAFWMHRLMTELHITI